MAPFRENLTFRLKKPEIVSFGTPIVEPVTSSHNYYMGGNNAQDELIVWCVKNGLNPGATVVLAELKEYQQHSNVMMWGMVLRHNRVSVHPRKVLMVTWHGSNLEQSYDPDELIIVAPAQDKFVTNARIETGVREWRASHIGCE